MQSAASAERGASRTAQAIGTPPGLPTSSVGPAGGRLVLRVVLGGVRVAQRTQPLDRLGGRERVASQDVEVGAAQRGKPSRIAASADPSSSGTSASTVATAVLNPARGPTCSSAAQIAATSSFAPRSATWRTRPAPGRAAPLDSRRWISSWPPPARPSAEGGASRTRPEDVQTTAEALGVVEPPGGCGRVRARQRGRRSRAGCRGAWRGRERNRSWTVRRPLPSRSIRGSGSVGRLRWRRC